MTKKISTRFFSLIVALFTIFAMIKPCDVYAASITSPTNMSFWGYAYQNTAVYNESKSSQIGTIYAGEGFTVLKLTKFPDGSNSLAVEYSTSSGPKYGYVLDSSVEYDYKSSAGAVVSSSTNVWYDYETDDYAIIGSVSAGENVCILAENTEYNMYYIEYNTNSGRKRGWCSCSNITKIGTQYLTIISLPAYNFYEVNSYREYYYHTVYAGPGANYYKVGSIGSSSSPEEVFVISTYSLKTGTWAYISYYSTSAGKFKTGYIKT